ncbi:Mitochondrial GTPase, partial [Ascosphaera pollenicola]
MMNTEPVEEVYAAESQAQERVGRPSYDEQLVSPTKTIAPQYSEITPLIVEPHKLAALRESADQQTPRRKESIWWLLPCLAMFTISYGGAVVPKMNLILSIVCKHYLTESHSHLNGLPGAENPQCRVPEVQSRTAIFTLLMILIPGALSAFASPKYGAASDSYGRLKMLAIVVFATMLSELTFLLVALNTHIFHLNVLLLGAVFEGLSGTVTCVLVLSTAYAADCIAPERRNVAFGYFHGVFFAGLALGPMMAGLMIKHTGNPLHVFYVSITLYLAFFVCVVFIVPESLSKERQEENREKHKPKTSSESLLQHLNPCRLLEPLSIFSQKVDHIENPKERKQAKKIKRNLLILAALETVVFGVKLGSSSVIIMYAEYLFGWGNVESSFFVSLVSTVRMLMLLGALPIMTRLIRGPQQGATHINTGCDMLDVGIIKTSVLIDVLCYIAYASSTRGLPFTVSGAIDAVGAMVSPTLQSALTKHVPPSQTGQ